MLEIKQTSEIQGKPFPCPVCGSPLPIEISQKQKPYCICNDCGIQLFFRGKAGIRRLHALLREKRPLGPDTKALNLPVPLYNRLAQLKQQREQLKNQQGLFFRDRDLDNALVVLEAELQQVQAELERARNRAEKKP
jgi:hypothetical protein